MGVRGWIRQLGSDPSSVDPDELVEAGLVAFAVSEIVVSRLAEADIRSVALEQSWYGSRFHVQTRPMARIMVRRADLPRARPIVDEVSVGW